MTHGELYTCLLEHRNCLEIWCPDCGYSTHTPHDGTHDGMWAARARAMREWRESYPVCYVMAPALAAVVMERRREDIAWHHEHREA
mgnify:FL=1